VLRAGKTNKDEDLLEMMLRPLGIMKSEAKEANAAMADLPLGLIKINLEKMVVKGQGGES